MKTKIALLGAGGVLLLGFIASATAPPEPTPITVLTPPVEAARTPAPTPTPTPRPTPTPTPVRAVVPRYSAICRDGSGSYSTGRGTCSWHGGVAYYTGY